MNKINTLIDHTLLKPEANVADYEKLCQEATQNKFATVCVPPSWVSYCYSEGVDVCTVIGFPLGHHLSKVKTYEAERAIKDGAKELDMVINISMAKCGRWKDVELDIVDVVSVSKDTSVKVILETAKLTADEIRLASLAALNAGADYIKTSTGFAERGASLEDIAIMKAVAGDQMKLKASGGIRDLETAMKYVEAGVHRLGTSSGVAIMNGLKGESSY